MKDDQNNEQPPSNPAGPVASQEKSRARRDEEHDSCLGDNCTCEPAEAVSEAWKATNKIMLSLGNMGVLDYESPSQSNSAWDGMLEDIQAAITAATADQQAEIAALRAVVAEYKEQTGCPICRRVEAERDALRVELATTRERLVNSEQRLIESTASNANEIAALRSQLQEAKRLNGELKEERDAARYIANQIARDLEIKRQKYGKIDADIRQAVRATGFCEIEGSTVGLVGSICDLATQRVKELEELRAARRKEVRITFDKIEGSFSVTFGRTGQTVKFEKPKHVAGNVENWLANLRHTED